MNIVSNSTVSNPESIPSWRQSILEESPQNRKDLLDDIKASVSAIHPTQTSGKSGFYIMLEKESPQRTYESDVSTYSSFYCKETDICRDSSDTESNSTFKTEDDLMQVEYEIASGNESPFSSNASSSGTEDIIIALATDSLSGSGSCSSDFADTEYSDSDTYYDSELSAADYWVCVKCKNKQNNPKYRYCEKCYQKRKNHVPPRPRLRKPRVSNKNKSHVTTARIHRSISPVSDTSNSDLKNSTTTDGMKDHRITSWLGKCTSANHNNNSSRFSEKNTRMRRESPFRKRKIVSINQNTSRLNSEAETSTDAWSDVDNANEFSIGCGPEDTPLPSTTTSPTYKHFHEKNISTNHSSSENKTVNLSNMSSNNFRVTNESRKRKFSTDNNIEAVNQFKHVKKDIDSDKSDCESSKTLTTHKDSGVSSATSSQEPVEHENFEEVCSQDTICSDFELKNLEIPETVGTLTRHISELPSTIENKVLVTNNLMRSLSSCSGDYVHHATNTINHIKSNRNPSLEMKERKTNSVQLRSRTILGLSESVFVEKKRVQATTEEGNYGNCMMCLSEPKNGVFVHNRFLHLCCCYKCAVKIFNKRKRCPICNCSVKNVMKLFVY